MTNTHEDMRRKIEGAQQLEGVVRTMKAQAASSITQYENAVQSLKDYTHTIEVALGAYFRQVKPVVIVPPSSKAVVAIVFGSDQGLVGNFNDQLTEMVKSRLNAEEGEKVIWTVGERIYGHLNDIGFEISKTFSVPNSITSITTLIGQLLGEYVRYSPLQESAKILIFYNRSQAAAVYEPTSQQLLPLDTTWQRELAQKQWASNNLPELMDSHDNPLLNALIREYLFSSLYRACAESLASENASRLAAMQRAEKNIDSLLEHLQRISRTLRQSTIDEELFDVIAAFETTR